MTTPAPQTPDAVAVERVNVNLTPDAVRALASLQDRTGLKKADLVNRALGMYEFIERELRSGSQIRVHDSDGREHRLVVFY